MPSPHDCDPWPCEDCLLDEFVCRHCATTYKMKNGPFETLPNGEVFYMTATCTPCYLSPFVGDLDV